MKRERGIFWFLRIKIQACFIHGGLNLTSVLLPRDNIFVSISKMCRILLCVNKTILSRISVNTIKKTLK